MEDASLPHALPGSANAAGVAPDDWRNDARAVQILSTEHWSLLASRSMSWNESFSRAGIFLTSLSGAVVALALVGQSTAYGMAFVTFALILLPVTLLIGLTTVVRLVQVNNADLLYLQAMNRLRHAYLDLVPGLEQYFSTSASDDRRSLGMQFAIPVRVNPVLQGFVTTPALVSAICSVIAGAIAGIVLAQLTPGLAGALVAGVVAFVVCFIGLAIYRDRTAKAFIRLLEVRFPRVGSE